MCAAPWRSGADFAGNATSSGHSPYFRRRQSFAQRFIANAGVEKRSDSPCVLPIANDGRGTSAVVRLEKHRRDVPRLIPDAHVGDEHVFEDRLRRVVRRSRFAMERN